MAYAWGKNTNPTNLGVGDTTSIHSSPAVIAGGRDYSAAISNSIAIGFDGNPYAFGYNSDGTLWNGTHGNTYTTIPQLVTAIGAPIKKVGGLRHSSLALTTAGDLWACGTEFQHEFGLGDAGILVPYYSGVKIHTGVTDFAVGLTHTVLLLNTGRVVVAGQNTYGQLGAGDTTDRTSWTDVTPSGTVVGIACGPNQSFVMMSDGTIYGAGVYSYGQLGPGLGDPASQAITLVTSWTATGLPTNTVELQCGWQQTSHANTGATDGATFVRLTDGTVWAVGLNGPDGSLGIGNATTPDSTATPTKVQLPVGVTAVSLLQSYCSVCMGCIGSDGNVYMWGRGDAGEMGNGTTSEPNPTPIAGTGLTGIQWLACWQQSVYAGMNAPASGPRSYGTII